MKGRWSEESLRKMSLAKRGIPRPDFAGEKHPNWKGGISRLSASIRIMIEYREWRGRVFRRDDFTCIFCLKRGITLNADHIKPFHEIIKENNIESVEDAKQCAQLWDIKNGRTLCFDCHKTVTFGSSQN